MDQVPFPERMTQLSIRIARLKTTQYRDREEFNRRLDMLSTNIEDLQGSIIRGDNRFPFERSRSRGRQSSMRRDAKMRNHSKILERLVRS